MLWLPAFKTYLLLCDTTFLLPYKCVHYVATYGLSAYIYIYVTLTLLILFLFFCLENQKYTGT